jgi:hypothetical protein
LTKSDASTTHNAMHQIDVTRCYIDIKNKLIVMLSTYIYSEKKNKKKMSTTEMHLKCEKQIASLIVSLLHSQGWR